jgi:predicted aldo/keto reductase-like oxidoreductase
MPELDQYLIWRGHDKYEACEKNPNIIAKIINTPIAPNKNFMKFAILFIWSQAELNCCLLGVNEVS